jgi:hypothetical protein
MNNEALIQALELELAGYIRRGLTDRARQVQQELLRLGRSTVSLPAENVPSKSESTPTPPATSAQKPPTASKPKPETKTPSRRKKP